MASSTMTGCGSFSRAVTRLGRGDASRRRGAGCRGSSRGHGSGLADEPGLVTILTALNPRLGRPSPQGINRAKGQSRSS